jgi:hypothetical protein
MEPSHTQRLLHAGQLILIMKDWGLQQQSQKSRAIFFEPIRLSAPTSTVADATRKQSAKNASHLV